MLFLRDPFWRYTTKINNQAPALSSCFDVGAGLNQFYRLIPISMSLVLRVLSFAIQPRGRYPAMQLPLISPTSDFPFLSVNVQFRQAVDDLHRFQTDGDDSLQQFEWKMTNHLKLLISEASTCPLRCRMPPVWFAARHRTRRIPVGDNGPCRWIGGQAFR